MSDANYWWFGFRQTVPKPPGQAIPCGPYMTYDEATKEGGRAKAWDCEVSTPYTASTKEEAAQKAKQFMESNIRKA